MALNLTFSMVSSISQLTENPRHQNDNIVHYARFKKSSRFHLYVLSTTFPRTLLCLSKLKEHNAIFGTFIIFAISPFLTNLNIDRGGGVMPPPPQQMGIHFTQHFSHKLLCHKLMLSYSIVAIFPM